MAQNRHWEQDKDATIYMGNIDERATPATMYEIMLQMGPIHNIHMPRDRVTQSHQGFGFVEFRTPTDAEYAANVMNGVKLYGKSLRVNKASADRQRATDIGAELFVGNLDPAVDEKLLYDTFSRFGALLALPKVARDDGDGAGGGASRGFGFVSFADFDSSDAAVENLNGQYLLSSQVTVQYAFKKDGKGERHGDEAERELAKQGKKRNVAPEAQPLPIGYAPAPSAGAGAGAGAGGPPPSQMPPPSAPSMSGLHGAGHPGSSATAPRPPRGFAPPPSISPGMHMGVGVGAGAGHPHHHHHHHHASPHMAGPPPSGFAPPPPSAHQQQQHHHHIPPRGLSPYNASNPPGGRGPPPVGSSTNGGVPLPPAPTGLPARPPQNQGGYNNPADYHPSGGGGSGYRGAPGTSSTAQQQQPPPPSGFPSAQSPPQQQQLSPGFAPPPPGAAVAGVPPPGLLPPGFQPPPQQQQNSAPPPTGFARW